MRPAISISPKRITLILAVLVLCLTVLGVAEKYVEFYVGHETIAGTESFVELFNVHDEDSVPTWFSVVTLLLCSLLLAAIAHDKKEQGARYVFHWRALSIIFLVLSLDEAAGFHEQASPALRAALNTTGMFYYAWVIPAGIFVIIFVLAYLGFLAGLPVGTRCLFIVAGALYVGGALGVEMLSAQYKYLYGKDFTYYLVGNFEEFLEMVGVVVFIHALMDYMRSHVKGVLISFGHHPAAKSDGGAGGAGD